MYIAASSNNSSALVGDLVSSFKPIYSKLMSVLDLWNIPSWSLTMGAYFIDFKHLDAIPERAGHAIYKR